MSNKPHPLNVTGSTLWWIPAELEKQIIENPEIPTDDKGRPLTLFGIPIVYADNLPSDSKDLTNDYTKP